MKWATCICRPESDWDDDQNYTVRTQMDSPSNVENNRHPVPSDWSDQEDFWNGKVYEKLPFSQCKYWDISDKNDSDWNDNLYPQNYRVRSQLQVPSRQPLPGWPKGVRQQSLLSPNLNTENHTNTNITRPGERRQPMMTQRRKRPHSWPKNVRPLTPISVDGNQGRPALNENEKERSEDNGKEMEVYYEPAKRDSNGIIISCI